MQDYLVLIPLLPLAGFLILSLAGKYLPKNAIATIGAGSVIISALIVLMLAAEFISVPSLSYTQVLWQWFNTEDLNVRLSLAVDALTTVFLFVITFVGALIHI